MGQKAVQDCFSVTFRFARHAGFFYGEEYWSARDLAPLLGYNKWERFEVAIHRAMTACEQVGQIVAYHFPASSKMVKLGSRAQRELTGYNLSRFACYLVAQNGDPRKPQIAAAQAYFAVSTRANEMHQLRKMVEERRRASKKQRLKIAKPDEQSSLFNESSRQE